MKTKNKIKYKIKMKKSLNNRLIEAVKKGRINDVKSLLKSGADVNSRDPIFFNDSALMFASKNSRNGSSLDIVKLLVKEGADVNAVNDYGASSLILASGETNDDSSYETVEFLLDSGADVNVRAYGGEYSLSEATLYSNSTSSLKTVKLLLDRGSNSNAIISDLNICQTKSCKILIQESLNEDQNRFRKVQDEVYSYVFGEESKKEELKEKVVSTYESYLEEKLHIF